MARIARMRADSQNWQVTEHERARQRHHVHLWLLVPSAILTLLCLQYPLHRFDV